MIYRRQEGTCITTMDVDWSEEQKHLLTISERMREREEKDRTMITSSATIT